MHLAPHAYAERTMLDEFQRLNWRWLIRNPLPREAIGDPTHSRRNAIYSLNRHQGEIHFFSATRGYLAWCPAEWLR